MFVDRVKIFVKGGDGGRGCVSFRREPYVPRGGPDGGVGRQGRRRRPAGGLPPEHPPPPPLPHRVPRRARRHTADPATARAAGGYELVVVGAPGTAATDEASGEMLGEVLTVGDRLLVARGGRGGRGNRAFLSNRNRAPREAEPGEPGEEHWLRLDLSLIADVGLLGAPNAGKSTLLSRLSAARPKIADYPFTTLHPVLGVVECDERTFVLADIPGIIEGAHAGAGLGLQFLRHVERTRVLVHVVDASGAGRARSPSPTFHAVRDEVRGLQPGAAGAAAAHRRHQARRVTAPDPLPALVERRAGASASRCGPSRR